MYILFKNKDSQIESVTLSRHNQTVSFYGDCAYFTDIDGIDWQLPINWIVYIHNA